MLYYSTVVVQVVFNSTLYIEYYCYVHEATTVGLITVTGG